MPRMVGDSYQGENSQRIFNASDSSTMVVNDDKDMRGPEFSTAVQQCPYSSTIPWLEQNTKSCNSK